MRHGSAAWGSEASGRLVQREGIRHAADLDGVMQLRGASVRAISTARGRGKDRPEGLGAIIGEPRETNREGTRGVFMRDTIGPTGRIS